MPDTEGVKISLLPSATNPADADILAGVQGNVTKKFSLSAIKAFIINAITPGGIGAVPDSRKINGHTLDSNFSLDADDVGARADNWMPTASDVGAAEPTQIGSISLSASWSGANPYYQTVTVTGATVTANSKVDIQLNAVQIANLTSAGVTGLVIENNNGTLTAWAVGATPPAITIQATITEVRP